MPYITKEEYEQMGFTTPDNFDALEKKAEQAINALTDYYDPYMSNHDLTVDVESSKKGIYKPAKAFKKAVALQVSFMVETGITSFYEAQKQDLSSYSVGDTSMTFKNGTVGVVLHGSTGIVNEAYMMLAKYGFMYRGVGHL